MSIFSEEFIFGAIVCVVILSIIAIYFSVSKGEAWPCQKSSCNSSNPTTEKKEPCDLDKCISDNNLDSICSKWVSDNPEEAENKLLEKYPKVKCLFSASGTFTKEMKGIKCLKSPLKCSNNVNNFLSAIETCVKKSN